MNNPILELISYLEEDIAAFYLKAEKLTRFQAYRTVFDLMQKESDDHADVIRAIDAKYTKPNFNRNAIYEIQEIVKNKLWEYVTKEEDALKVVEKMAEAELTVSKLYHSISEHCRHMATYYTKLSEEIETLSKQEIDHKESLLHHKANYL